MLSSFSFATYLCNKLNSQEKVMEVKIFFNGLHNMYLIFKRLLLQLQQCIYLNHTI